LLVKPTSFRATKPQTTGDPVRSGHFVQVLNALLSRLDLAGLELDETLSYRFCSTLLVSMAHRFDLMSGMEIGRGMPIKSVGFSVPDMDVDPLIE